jgi:hypothetical protein
MMPDTNEQKRPFEPSELVEYGSVEEFTRTGGGGTADSADGSTGYSS